MMHDGMMHTAGGVGRREMSLALCNPVIRYRTSILADKRAKRPGWMRLRGWVMGNSIFSNSLHILNKYLVSHGSGDEWVLDFATAPQESG